jgi:two-component system, sensor histidine kinase and response regulator
MKVLSEVHNLIHESEKLSSDNIQVTEAFRELNDSYRLLIENTHDAIFIIQDGMIQFLNPRTVNLSGYSKEELTSNSFVSFIHSEDRELVSNRHQECMGGENLPEVYPFRFVNKDGKVKWVESKTVSICWAGRPATLNFLSDVTYRMEAEQALKESERRNRMFADNARDVIWVFDTNLNHVYLSPSVKYLRGYSVEEAMKQSFEETLTPESYKKAIEMFGKEYMLEQSGHKHDPDWCQTIELEMTHKNGSYVWVETRITLLRDENGDLSEVMGISRDITERKRVEEQLLQAKLIAEEANRAKSEFLANMSHEIRTPMNGVLGMTTLLLDTALTSEQHMFADSVMKSAESLLGVINDILDFSKIEAGKYEIETIDFDLRIMLEDLCDLLAFRAHEKGLECVCLVEPEVPSRLQGDPGRLRQIITNLVGNAIKFTSKGAVEMHVTLESEDVEQAVIRFIVKDTGIGIPADKLSSLFHPFTQADASVTRKYGGTGLGLTISKSLADMLGGDIGVESKEGRGSTFWFTALFKKQPPEIRALDTIPGEIADLHVLVVDDNDTNRSIFVNILNMWHCRTDKATNAVSAMDKLHTAINCGDPFSIALIAMIMPEIDGETLGGLIKEDPELHHTNLVMIASAGIRGDAIRLEKAGFSAYLTQPVKRSQLLACIKTIAGIQENTETRPRIVTRHSLIEDHKRRIRILLAEDNPTNQIVALKLLERIGYHADVVPNGIEAIKALQAIPYDLVFMDIQMPGMDGFTASNQIRSGSSGVLNPKIHIIAMTAHAMKGDREKCLKAGMDDYISKPIQAGELSEVLARWIDNEPPALLTSDAPIPAVSEAAVFDRAALLNNMGDDEEITNEIIHIFLQDAPRQIDSLAKAVAEGNINLVNRQAHTLKGAAGNVCADVLQASALEMEKAGKIGDMTRAESLLVTIKENFEAFQSEIKTQQLGFLKPR